MPNSPESVDQKLEALRKDFCDKLPARVQRVEELWNKLQRLQWSRDAFRILHRMTAALAQAANAAGITAVAEVAQSLEVTLKSVLFGAGAPTEKERGLITALVADLRDAAQHCPEVSPVPEATGKKQPTAKNSKPPATRTRAVRSKVDPQRLVYLLGADAESTDFLSLQIHHSGFDVKSFLRMSDARRAVKSTPPAALILDIACKAGKKGPFAALFDIRKQAGDARFPVVVISAHGDVATRLQAMRAGSDAFVTRPFEVGELVDRVETLVARRARNAVRVLMVQEDAAIADEYAEGMRSAGMDVKAIPDPFAVLEEMQRLAPDLVVLDMHFEDCTGIELAAILRQEKEWEPIPILFLCDVETFDRHKEDVPAGLGDVLLRPMAPADLTAAVSIRVQYSRELIKKIQYMGRRDPQTGLYNRKYFLNELELAVARPPRHGEQGILYIVLDNFKHLKDALGILAADVVPKEVVNMLRRSVEDGDVIARFGDIVFTVLVRRNSVEAIEKLARRVCQALDEEVIRLDGRTVGVSCSIGIARIESGARQAREVLSRADLACEVARGSGGNQSYLYNPVVDQQAEKERDSQMAKAIRAALRKDQLRLVYQPVVNLRGRPEKKFEVLVRMTDARGQELYPGQFLPIAESNDLMADVDRWVVTHALEVMESEQNSKREVAFFINISPYSLKDGTFISWLRERLGKSKIGRKNLIFEIAEGAVENHRFVILDFVKAVRKLGCGFALDRFGSGPDSLRILDRFQVDFVKIDGTLMHNLSLNRQTQSTVKSLVEKSHSIGVPAIAEFVEDASSLAMLWQFGVEYTQGNFLQAPEDHLDYDFDQGAL